MAIFVVGLNLALKNWASKLYHITRIKLHCPTKGLKTKGLLTKNFDGCNSYCKSMTQLITFSQTKSQQITICGLSILCLNSENLFLANHFQNFLM